MSDTQREWQRLYVEALLETCLLYTSIAHFCEFVSGWARGRLPGNLRAVALCRA